MKKSFLALLCASFLLVGCGGGSKESGATSSSEQGSQTSQQSQQESSQQQSESQQESQQESESQQQSESQQESQQESESQEESQQESSQGELPDLPVEEGKTTFWFTLGEESVALPEYANFYITGAFAGWATAADAVPVFELLEGTEDVYYAIFDGEPAEFSYQLTAGYKADAGAPTSGVDWEFKSVECAAYPYGSDPAFEVVDGLAALGEHNWEAMPADPAAATIHNLTVEVPFSAPVPEYIDIHLAGGSPFSWTLGEETILTPNEDRTVFSMTVESIIGNNYSIKVLANYADQDPGWDFTILDDGEGGNYNFAVMKTWGDDYHADLAVDSWQDDDVFTIDWETWMPALGDNVAVDLVVNFDAEVTAEAIYAIGNFTGWDAAEMLTEDHITYTLDCGELPAGYEMQFGVCADTGWHLALKLGGDNNSAIVGDTDTTITIDVYEGGAAFMNQEVDPEQWLNFEYGTLTDAEGEHEFLPEVEVNPIDAVYAAEKGDEVTVWGMLAARYGTANEYYLVYGNRGIDLYGVTSLPEGVELGGPVGVTGTVDIYKGLYELKNCTLEVTDAVVPEPEILVLNGQNFAKENLNRPCAVFGTVVEGKAIDGTANVSVEVEVEGGYHITIYVKRNLGLDYAALNTALGTTGAAVAIGGFVGIFANDPVDYANLAAYQVVNPAVIPEN